MPPVNQGSKAALITWTVIATVFGITMAVLALITYAGKNDVQAQLNAERDQFNNFASAADLQGARLTELSQQAQAQNTGNVYRLLTNREETLAQSATGTTRFENATATIDSTLERLNSQYEGINAASLVDAIQLLETRLADMRRQAQVLQQAQEELTAELQRNAETSQQQLAQKDEMIAGLTEQLEEVQAMFRTVEERKTELETGSTQSIADLRANWEEQLRQAEDRLTQVTRALESSQRQVQILTQQNKDRFGGDQMIASPDGRVIRSPSQGRLYINLGRNQGVTNGMTFQVYDSVRGIPKATEDNPSELPIGKGSIQVIRVDPNSAEARVVSQQPGQSIREGDLIANLAYDRNVPVRFRIYGDFDLDHDGETHPRDYDRMLTITREFGGRIVDDVTVETDVLVLGQEPVVPNYTPEQLQDPIYNQQYTNAVTRRDAYLSVRNQAQQLNIPILNQNQFLYYVGYFEQVGR